MATHRPAKNGYIKPFWLLLLIVSVIIIFVCVFFDGLETKTTSHVTHQPNFKYIQNNIPKPLGPNNIQTFDEMRLTDEDLKHIAKFFPDDGNKKQFMIQKMDPTDKDCPINMELLEWNKKLID